MKRWAISLWLSLAVLSTGPLSYCLDFENPAGEGPLGLEDLRQEAPDDHEFYPEPEDRGRDTHPPSREEHWVDVLGEFQRIESEFLYWDNEYSQAPSGSYRERQADDRRRSLYERAEFLMSDPYALRRNRASTIERFAEENDRKYDAAISGQLRERFYDAARRSAWRAFGESLGRELEHSRDWREIIRKAEDFHGKYQQARSDSLRESAYRDAADRAWGAAERSLEWDLGGALHSVSELESMAEEFDRAYQQAQGGSRRERFYDQATRTACDGALKAFERDLWRSHGDRRLSALEAEYNRRYQAARGGSRREAYFREVRDLIRRHLDRH